MEDLTGLICRIRSFNGKLVHYHKFYPIPATMHDCETQVMVMGSPNFIFFNKYDIYDKMMSMWPIYFDEKNPDIHIRELIFSGTPVFTTGEIINMNPRCECKISIHRYASKKFIFIVLVNEKIWFIKRINKKK
jgi:hypothetical protein